METKRLILRRFKETDAVSVSELIRKTIRISNVKDYPTELMDSLIEIEDKSL